ncbi:MAG: flagellar basal body P-ring formation protein FlgA [Hyphomicrobiales bacterium]|jgi:flagella basal body P-ring formation protein FlgA|nr:flagellar basal body P-ring formation protein FlgA [Hyphomicrobiales bacterium]
MIRTALSILLLAAAASPAAAQMTATPQLKSDVTVSGEVVRIGDLVTNAGPAAATPIFRAPDLGRTGALPAQRVLDAVMPHGLIVVDARDITEVTVRRAARVIAVDDLEARIARALAGRNTLGDAKNLKLVFDREVRPIALEPTVMADLVIARMSYDAYSRRFDLTFEIADSDAARRTWRYTGTAMETVEIASVSRALARGDVVKISDVTIERRPKSELTGEPVAQPSDVVGLAARRPVRVGAALRTADLMKPELVQRNETVTLSYQVPGIVVTLRGKALDSGAEGDTVSVQNTETKRTVQGTVTGPGRVTVSSAPSRFAKADDTKR